MRSVFNLNDQNEDLDSKITVGLEKIASVFRYLIWEDAKDLKLSPIQLQILIFVNYHSSEYATVSYLSKEFSVTKPTISDAVKSLELKELIQKNIDLNDSRSYTIQLTNFGKEYVLKSESFASPLLQLIQDVDTQSKKQLWETLSKLIYQLHQKDIITVQRICYSCSFYSEKAGKSYCNLLNKDLKKEDIRIDCPEHKIA
jgi:DNA-binding MarR family transcriptional regulator